MDHQNPSRLVLVSACLVGQSVRYDGKALRYLNPVLARWQDQGRVIPFCPEVASGLPVPRPPAEIRGGDGPLVLNRNTPILDTNQRDVTRFFISGARKTLAVARTHRIRVAVLKDGSPSCGSSYVYDGTFSRTRRCGVGVTTALLEASGICVFTESQTSAAARMLCWEK